MGQPQDDRQSDRIVCEGGLDSTQNHLNLSLNKPGAATRLINYEVGIDGGYRRVNGFEVYDDNYSEVGVGVAEGPVLGIIIFDNTVTNTTQIIAARKNTADANYSLYLYDSGAGWTPIVTGLTLVATNVLKIRWDVAHDGARNHLCFVDGVNKAVLYDGTTWTQIDSTNDGLTLATAGGAQAVDAPSLVTFFKSTLFLAGDASAKGVVSYSAPNAFYDFLSANGAGQAIANFSVMQIKPFRDDLYVFGANAICKLAPDVASGFVKQDVTGNIGLLAADAVVEIGGDLVFLSPDGFRPVQGTAKIGDVQLEGISKAIQSMIQQRLLDASEHTNSVVIRSKSQFRVLFNNPGLEAGNTKGIIGGLRTADQMNGWEFGELRGFRASCITSRYIGNEEYVLAGDYNGKVYRHESSSTQDGADMLAVYATPYLDFGDTEIRKLAERITLFVKGSSTINISMEVRFDWGDTDAQLPAPYDLTLLANINEYGDGSLYGDGSTYGAVVPSRLVQTFEGSFFSAQFTFTTYGDIAPYAIHGLIVEYGTEGRR